MSLPGDELRHLRITAVPDCRPVNQNTIKRLNETETGHRLRRPCPAAEPLLGTHLDRPFQRSGQTPARVSNFEREGRAAVSIDGR
jgi:hypothetical protein